MPDPDHPITLKYHSPLSYADAIADVLCYLRGYIECAQLQGLSVGPEQDTIVRLRQLKTELLREPTDG
jgi:hypothetical protein